MSNQDDDVEVVYTPHGKVACVMRKSTGPPKNFPREKVLKCMKEVFDYSHELQNNSNVKKQYDELHSYHADELLRLRIQMFYQYRFE